VYPVSLVFGIEWMETEFVVVQENARPVLRGRDRAAAVDLARRVVADLAPDELPVFELRSRRHFRPAWTTSKDPLSSGLDITLTSITDAALAAAQGAVGLTLVLLAERVHERTSGRVLTVLRRRFRRTGEDDAPPPRSQPWTGEQLASIREEVVKVLTGRVNARLLDLIADSIIARLALQGQEEQEQQPDDGPPVA
jgi:hypothetical protein